MPRSERRKSLEIPTALYEQLKADAATSDRTIADLAADLITAGRTERAYLSDLREELSQNRLELERMRRQIAELGEIMRGLASMR